MTIGYLEFDGDSHESSAHWFGMTMLFEALASRYKYQFVSVLTKADNLNTNLSVSKTILYN